jgi:hypothetical protein
MYVQINYKMKKTRFENSIAYWEICGIHPDVLMAYFGASPVELYFKGCYYRVIWDRLHNCSFAFTRTKMYCTYALEVSDAMHLCSMNERKTNFMHLWYIFIVAVGDALHVSGVFAHRQER